MDWGPRYTLDTDESGEIRTSQKSEAEVQQTLQHATSTAVVASGPKSRSGPESEVPCTLHPTDAGLVSCESQAR